MTPEPQSRAGISAFRRELLSRNPDPEGRSWIFVPYDQTSDRIGPLSRMDPADVGVVLVESPQKASLRPYHKQKLALILSNLRHFALEQAARGVAVRHIVSRGSYSDALAPVAAEAGGLTMMRAAERELRLDVARLVADGLIDVVPHEGWLTTPEQFAASQKGPPPWRMDAFYRRVRRESGILMEDGRPVGGKFSFDVDNRQPWPGTPAAPTPPDFPLDPIKAEVLELVQARFETHPGVLVPHALCSTQTDAEALWSWAKTECLPLFGPYEDAMSEQSDGLFHSRIAFLLHVHRLLPRRVVRDVAQLDVPLASKEGFVRQVLGWREFMRHVHARTDGLRDLSGESKGEPTADPGKPGALPAAPSALDAANALPDAYWGSTSGLHCLDSVVDTVLTTGYSHHISRLMVLSNIASLLDVSPRELTDWFWSMYTDAFDWVVEPNVLGMGTFGAGDLMTTKPYVSGAAYINRMSDYCQACVFDPKATCPLTSMYWAYLERHEDLLKDVPRMRLSLASMRKRKPDRRKADRQVFETVSRTLREGRSLGTHMHEDHPVERTKRGRSKRR